MIGVLALQGDFLEHCEFLQRSGFQCAEVRTAEELEKVEALIIPGGESTTIGKMLGESGLGEEIKKRASSGMPVLGTCAGAILMAKEVLGASPYRLNLMDIEVERNGYGRQVDSFEGEIKSGLGRIRGVFIRAPKILKAGPACKVLARLNGNPVLVEQGNLVAATFHPELSNEGRVLGLFASKIKGRTNKGRSEI